MARSSTASCPPCSPGVATIPRSTPGSPPTSPRVTHCLVLATLDTLSPGGANSGDSDLATPAHTIAAGLGLAAQFTALVASRMGVLMPGRINFQVEGYFTTLRSFTSFASFTSYVFYDCLLRLLRILRPSFTSFTSFTSFRTVFDVFYVFTSLRLYVFDILTVCRTLVCWRRASTGGPGKWPSLI